MENRAIINKNKKLLAKDLSLAMLEAVSDVLNSDLNDVNKDNIVAIILGCENAFVSENDFIDLIYRFFLNEMINKKGEFKEIINLMHTKKKAINVNTIPTYIMIGKKVLDIGEDRAIKLARNLVNLSSDYYQNFRLMTALLEDDRILKDIDRFDIIADVLTKIEASYSVLNGEDTKPFVVEVLANENFNYAKRENIDFRKIVLFVIENFRWHFVYSFLKMGMDAKKIELAIDYYISLYDKYIIDWEFVTLDKLDGDFKGNALYKLPVCKSNLTIDDYAKDLQATKDSTNPISHSIVETSDISVERKGFILNLIDSSKENYRREYGKLEIDYLNSLAVIAVSPLASYLSFIEYQDLLSYIKANIMEDAALRKTDENYYFHKNVYCARIEFLTSLFTKASFYRHNMVRLDYLISLIKRMMINNYYVLSEIIEIAISPNSMYYSDEEFASIVKLMTELHDSENKEDSDKYFILKYLFKNKNVPFMNRGELIAIARDKSEAEIKELTERCNNEGLINRNMAVLNGTLTGVLEKEFILKKKTKND